MQGSILFFSKGEFSAPHGMIDLSTCMTVKSAELKVLVSLTALLLLSSTIFFCRRLERRMQWRQQLKRKLSICTRIQRKKKMNGLALLESKLHRCLPVHNHCYMFGCIYIFVLIYFTITDLLYNHLQLSPLRMESTQIIIVMTIRRTINQFLTQFKNTFSLSEMYIIMYCFMMVVYDH